MQYNVYQKIKHQYFYNLTFKLAYRLHTCVVWSCGSWLSSTAMWWCLIIAPHNKVLPFWLNLDNSSDTYINLGCSTSFLYRSLHRIKCSNLLSLLCTQHIVLYVVTYSVWVIPLRTVPTSVLKLVFYLLKSIFKLKIKNFWLTVQNNCVAT